VELISAVLLVVWLVWLVGVVLTAFSVVHFVNKGEGELHERYLTRLETDRGPLLVVTTVLTVFWPATLVYGIATRRKN
jgi:uncharacterized membrane protein YecN with MAPEG domain